MIKVIIFDLAGVITSRGYLLWMKEEIPNFKNNKLFYNDISDKFCLGMVSVEEFTKMLAKKTGINKNVIWENIFKKIKINSKLLKIIKQLKKKYKIILLTNYHHRPLKELFVKYDLEKYFDLKVVSSLQRSIKPDVKIYQKTLALFKIKPEEAIFIDDSQKNVDGGEKAGIKSLLFTTNNKLLEDLKDYNVII